MFASAAVLWMYQKHGALEVWPACVLHQGRLPQQKVNIISEKQSIVNLTMQAKCSLFCVSRTGLLQLLDQKHGAQGSWVVFVFGFGVK